MHDQIRDRLIEVARKGTVTYYSEIAPMAGLNMSLPNDRYEIGALLDDINRAERAEDRPLLSAIVVHKDTLVPGQGFFTMARDMDLFRGSDRDRFYIEELRRVHDYWARH